MAQIIQLRRDTAANWTTANPTLAQGEIGIETDTKKLKIGDGATAWNSLSYFGSGFVSAVVDSNVVSSFNVTTENFVRVIGPNPVTINLDPVTSPDSVIVKNTSTGVVSVVNTGGTGLVNGVSSIELNPIDAAPLGPMNYGESRTFVKQGGEFWLN